MGREIIRVSYGGEKQDKRLRREIMRSLMGRRNETRDWGDKMRSVMGRKRQTRDIGERDNEVSYGETKNCEQEIKEGEADRGDRGKRSGWGECERETGRGDNATLNWGDIGREKWGGDRA